MRTRASIVLVSLAAAGFSGCGDDVTPALPMDLLAAADLAVRDDLSTATGDLSMSTPDMAMRDLAMSTPDMAMSAASDLSIAHDLSTASDLSIAHDLSTAMDLTVAIDLFTPSDLTVPRDLLPSPDLTPRCGDGVITGSEVCDGAALAGATCTSLGHAPGTLACAATCDHYDASGCTGGYIAANTSFSGTVCVDGLRYGAPSQTPLLAVCTDANGIWRGLTTNATQQPLADPTWANADGTVAGQQVTSLTGRGVAVLNANGKVAFWTTNTTGLNFWGTNVGSFTANPPVWMTGGMNQVAFAQQIFATRLGSSNNNYFGGFDPTSGEAIMFHGNTTATACTANGQSGCSWPVLLGAGVTGTVTSIASGNDNLTQTTFDIHVAVNGNSIYWSCDNGASYVPDDNGLASGDKTRVFKLTPDYQSYVAHTATRACAATGTNVSVYASTMYAALLGGASIYKTTDGGATWAAANTGLPSGVSVNAIAIDCGGTTNGATNATCANDQLLYAATGAGLYKSVDAGAHWTLDGLEGSVVRAVTLESQHPNSTIAASPTGAIEVGNIVTFTVNSHNLQAGDAVTVINVGAGYNGNWTVASVISPTQFTVAVTQTGLAPSGGGSVYKTLPRVFAATDQPNAIFQTNVP